MKIIYIANSGKIQGAGVALFNILSQITCYGVTPHVVLPEHGAIEDKLKQMSIEYSIFYYRACVCPPTRNIVDSLLWVPRFLYTVIVNLGAFLRFYSLVKKISPDLIHSNSGVIRFGSQVSRLKRIPHIWHIREYQTLDFGWIPIGGLKYQRKLYSNRNNHCIAITRGVYEYFCLSSKDCVLYDGVFPKSHSSTYKEKQNYLLFVGCLKAEKGVIDIFNAFEKIHTCIDPNIEMWFAGKDEIRINELIDNSKCPSRYKYLGFRSDIYELMSKAKALIVPSRFEGFGFITAEAMANHCPVIGNNTAGTKEQFDNGYKAIGKEIGYRYTNIDGLCNAIMHVCSKSEHRELTESAYKVVMDYYNIENSVSNLSDFYNKVISL